MAEVVGIRFKENGKIYYFDPDSKMFSKGEQVIVETVRGIECGMVATPNHKITESEIMHPLKKVIRIATDEDIEIILPVQDYLEGSHIEKKKQDDGTYSIVLKGINEVIVK